jgi:hypothetical protein
VAHTGGYIHVAPRGSVQIYRSAAFDSIVDNSTNAANLAGLRRFAVPILLVVR